MRVLKTKAIHPKEKCWYALDASGLRLGRVASPVATILSGKRKVEWTPNYDHGDFVVIYNCDQLECTTKDKTYWRHTGYPGGIKSKTFTEAVERDGQSDHMMLLAVKRMLKRSPLGRQMMAKLKCYKGAHPHQAQQPVELKLDEGKLIITESKEGENG